MIIGQRPFWPGPDGDALVRSALGQTTDGRTDSRTDRQTDRRTDRRADTRTSGECIQKTKGTGTFSYPGAQSQFHSPGFPATKFPRRRRRRRRSPRRSDLSIARETRSAFARARARVYSTRGWARRSVSVKASLFLSAAPWCPVMAKAIYTGCPSEILSRLASLFGFGAAEFIYAPRIPNALVARWETVNPFARARTHGFFFFPPLFERSRLPGGDDLIFADLHNAPWARAWEVHRRETSRILPGFTPGFLPATIHTYAFIFMLLWKFMHDGFSADNEKQSSESHCYVWNVLSETGVTHHFNLKVSGTNILLWNAIRETILLFLLTFFSLFIIFIIIFVSFLYLSVLYFVNFCIILIWFSIISLVLLLMSMQLIFFSFHCIIFTLTFT